MTKETKRILVVGPSWIGDMVLSQSLYKSLKRQSATTEIDVVAPAWSKALLHRMPEVSNAVEMPIGHGEMKLRTRYRLGRQLRQRNYNQAIIIPRSMKAALLAWFANIPIRTGYRGEMRYGLINDMRMLDRESMPKIVTRFVFLGEPPGVLPHGIDTPRPALIVDQNNRDACLQRLGLKKDTPVLVLIPGAAYGKSKQWPVEYFSEIARRYVDKGWQVWVFGSTTDCVLGEQIKESVPRGAVNLCGQTTLEEAIDLMSIADMVVANDSGMMHVAAAVGRPLVAMYGSTAESYAPPMTSHAKCLSRNLECSPCRSRTCRYGHYRCLTEISPDEVYEATCRIGKLKSI